MTAVRWLDLRELTTWGMDVQSDLITYPLLQRLCTALGYAGDTAATASGLATETSSRPEQG
jgi:hypothetical protein